ncbi:MAG: hypothetical protein GWN67_11860 [Phycisphaerae bacterium]|nr:hypothetical protein [Phycisphaerae bacterium]NIP50723.1 hypothetical protein [Phycisphaerae bacterium]NIS49896.1 hypothetical protein [Phycisphaerae bacterium]NIU07579.1 hypothetical protein [Phycisphaerae bacterium]NIU57045.1 hypothetical protein [Phycisphaerae bacterium]
MSKKGYAVALVLAGMIFGVLLVSMTSSPASAKLPSEGRNVTMNVSETVRPVAVKAVTTPVRPVVARPNIRVYPVGRGGKDDDNSSAYIVKDGKVWFCENTLAQEITFR